MSSELRQLPPVKVPESLYQLIRLVAFKNELSVSGAVRKILTESELLIQTAKENNIDLSEISVAEWGGSRIDKEK